MSTAAAPQPPVSTPDASPQLRAGALGLLGTVSMTAAYMAPAASLIALFGAIVLNVGQAAGFVMLLGLLITLPSGISFGMLAREMPSAGGVHTWATRTLGPLPGRWMGLTTAGYYLLTVFFPPLVFGQLFNTLLEAAGMQASPAVWAATWALGAMLSLIITAVATFRGIVVSSFVAFGMLLVQLVVMSAVAIACLAVAAHAGRLSTAPFVPSSSPAGWSGILLALPLVLLSLVCDGATPAAEETRNARRTIPLAIMLTLIVVGGWNVLAFGALTMAAPGAELAALAADATINPVPTLAGRIWGPFTVLVSLVGASAMLGALAPCATATSRLVFSLGREGVLPAWFSRVDAGRQVPRNALIITLAITFLATVPPGLYLGPAKLIAWWGNVIVWYIACVYLVANLCNLIYFAGPGRATRNLLWNVAAPLLAMTVQAWIIYRVVIVELWNAGGFGRSAQATIVLLTVVTALWALRRPQTHS